MLARSRAQEAARSLEECRERKNLDVEMVCAIFSLPIVNSISQNVFPWRGVQGSRCGADAAVYASDEVI